MNYSKPRTYTVEKYTLYLKSLIIKINKYGELFSSTKFKEENPIPQNFISICQQLNYISSFNKGCRNEKVFHAIIKSEDVTKLHGLAIAEASLRYNIKHSEQYDKSGNRIVTSKEKCEKKVENVVVGRNLSNISTQELLNELKRRGYSGELTKSVLI